MNDQSLKRNPPDPPGLDAGSVAAHDASMADRRNQSIEGF